VLTINGPLVLEIGSRGLVDVLHVSDQDTEISKLFVALTLEPANGWFENNLVSSIFHIVIFVAKSA